MEHESSTTIPVSPDLLYQQIADVGKLSAFIPPLKSVRKTDGDHVEVEAEYEGREEHGEAYFRTDDDAKRVEWGTEGHPYRGWMQVESEGDGGSKLTFHLTYAHPADIQQYIDSTFDSIRKMF
jgi:ribosome-associated toxin RatA of RatAB toxin-antitoxin module